MCHCGDQNQDWIVSGETKKSLPLYLMHFLFVISIFFNPCYLRPSISTLARPQTNETRPDMMNKTSTPMRFQSGPT